MKPLGQSVTHAPDPPAFSKMAGGGNDFVIIDNRSHIITDAAGLARKICTRRLSVGADGLILIETSARATFRMRYFNSDGSNAEFCANGTRCAARFAFLNVIAPRRMTIETGAGAVGAEVDDGSAVTLSLSPPNRYLPNRPLRVGQSSVNGSLIVVGVPHYVLFLKRDLWKQDIEPLGKAIRSHPELQPQGANVDFVVIRDWNNIEVRTYERGVEGETLSCGSGVVASVASSALFGKVRSPVSVLTRSGIKLEVSFTLQPSGAGKELTDVRLKGDARLIYRSALTPDTLDGFDPDWVRDPQPKEHVSPV
ncbi:MAG TPA: diaminopimelate epimerase [Thermoanaerobaculia bacterium]|nr:diaminopimelate epimerase [Thermoanaerobaculia bacterium]